MPKICYAPKDFRGSSLEVIEQANAIIAEYQAEGYELTLRQLYYQFVSRDLIPNRQKEYKRLGSIINDGRMAGMIDWYAIEDRTRNLSAWRHYVDAAVEAYRAAVLAADPFEDLLGLVYQEENSRGQRNMNGQFFTPPALCRMMARANVVDDWTPGPAPDGGLWTLYEPACGAGGMMLAVLAELLERFRTPDVLLLWDVAIEDLDLTCARTAALQIVANLALRGWSVGRVTVHHANALTQERFATVLHATNGEDPEALPRMWAALAPAVAVAGLISRVQALVDEALPAVEGAKSEEEVGERGQLTLFSGEAA